MKKLQLQKGEMILAVVPKLASGPGWSNEPTFVYILTLTGKIREECIQPDEASPKLLTLFRPAAVMHEELLKAIPVESVE